MTVTQMGDFVKSSAARRKTIRQSLALAGDLFDLPDLPAPTLTEPETQPELQSDTPADVSVSGPFSDKSGNSPSRVSPRISPREQGSRVSSPMKVVVPNSSPSRPQPPPPRAKPISKDSQETTSGRTVIVASHSTPKLHVRVPSVTLSPVSGNSSSPFMYSSHPQVPRGPSVPVLSSHSNPASGARISPSNSLLQIQTGRQEAEPLVAQVTALPSGATQRPASIIIPVNMKTPSLTASLEPVAGDSSSISTQNHSPQPPSRQPPASPSAAGKVGKVVVGVISPIPRTSTAPSGVPGESNGTPLITRVASVKLNTPPEFSQLKSTSPATETTARNTEGLPPPPPPPYNPSIQAPLNPTTSTTLDEVVTPRKGVSSSLSSSITAAAERRKQRIGQSDNQVPGDTGTKPEDDDFDIDILVSRGIKKTGLSDEKSKRLSVAFAQKIARMDNLLELLQPEVDEDYDAQHNDKGQAEQPKLPEIAVTSASVPEATEEVDTTPTPFKHENTPKEEEQYSGITVKPITEVMNTAKASIELDPTQHKQTDYLGQAFGTDFDLNDIIPTFHTAPETPPPSLPPPIAKGHTRGGSDKIGMSTPASASDAPWIVVRKFEKRGGFKIQVPDTLSDLLAIGGEKLGIIAVAMREITTEAKIDDINALKNDDVVFLMTAEEEKSFT